MINDYIYKLASKIKKKYGTCNPASILKSMGVTIKEENAFESLKGYCFMSCRIIYVVINDSLSYSEKQMVLAHELGHILLHKKNLKIAPMKETSLGCHKDTTEREANLFAAELLIVDEEIKYGDINDIPYPDEFINFKLYAMNEKGYGKRSREELQSDFLAK